jgi:hypothetical protein
MNPRSDGEAAQIDGLTRIATRPLRAGDIVAAGIGHIARLDGRAPRARG